MFLLAQVPRKINIVGLKIDESNRLSLLCDVVPCRDLEFVPCS